nr:hypothetical protein [Paenibacillus sp. IHB B 3084]
MSKQISIQTRSPVREQASNLDHHHVQGEAPQPENSSPVDTANPVQRREHSHKTVGRVLVIHNFYQQSGGEDKVVEQELAMLRSRGIETEHYYVHNDSIQSKGLVSMAKLAVEAAWSLPEFKRIKSCFCG